MDAATTSDSPLKSFAVRKTVKKITNTAYENTTPSTVAKASTTTGRVTGTPNENVTRSVAPGDAGARSTVAVNVSCVTYALKKAKKNNISQTKVVKPQKSKYPPPMERVPDPRADKLMLLVHNTGIKHP